MLADHDELVRLSHAAASLTCLQSGMTEASDRPETTRHLDLDYSCVRWSDKPYVCYGTSGPKARDGADARHDRRRHGTRRTSLSWSAS